MPVKPRAQMRAWLAIELAQRREQLTCKNGFVLYAEIMESFLFPFWQDAGLVTLSLGAVDSYYAARSTGLKGVDVTPMGREVFARLAEISPQDFPRPERRLNDDVELEEDDDLDDDDYEDDEPFSEPEPGRWQDRYFFMQLENMAPFYL